MSSVFSSLFFLSLLISFTSSFIHLKASQKPHLALFLSERVAETHPVIPSIPKATPKPVISIAQNELSTTDLAIAGALAAIVGDIALQPIDCIKTIQQTNLGAEMNIIETSQYVYNNLGFGGFYTGLLPFLVGDSIGSAWKFSSYENFKSWTSKNIANEDILEASTFLFAGLSFMFAATVLAPGELIKSKMQIGQVTSFLDGITSIYNANGIQGLYTGFSSICARDVPYTMIELGLYDTLKKYYLQIKNRNNEGETKSITQVDEIIAAIITGGFAGYFTTPFDTIKTKVMVDDHTLYTGVVDCFVKTVNDYGIDALCHGGLARAAYVIPFTAIYLPCYDFIKRKMMEFKR